MDEFHRQVNDFKKCVQRERIQKELRTLDTNWILWAIGGLSLLILVFVLGAYFWNFHGTLSVDSNDWSEFGSFVGGSAGPPLALLSVLGLLVTVRQQSRALTRAVEQSRMEQHIRALEGFLADLQRIELMRIDAEVTFADVLAGHASDESKEKNKDEDTILGECESGDDKYQVRLHRAFRYYQETLFRYCEMVAMHRDNNDHHWDLQMYVSRGKRVVDSLRPFSGYLNPQFLAIIELNLEDGWGKGTAD